MGGVKSHEVSDEEGSVGARDKGSCRIRRNPEDPSPCSCSGISGALAIPSYSIIDPASNEKRILDVSAALADCPKRLPVLLFLGSETLSAGFRDIQWADVVDWVKEVAEQNGRSVSDISLWHPGRSARAHQGSGCRPRALLDPQTPQQGFNTKDSRRSGRRRRVLYYKEGLY